MMTDLELTVASALAMGYQISAPPKDQDFTLPLNVEYSPQKFGLWNPIKDNGQALAIVKKLKLDIAYFMDSWVVVKVQGNYEGAKAGGGGHQDLNRAIVECAAKVLAADLLKGEKNNG